MNTKWKVILSVMLLLVAFCTFFATLLLQQQTAHIESIITGKSESAVTLAHTILSGITQRYQKRIIAFTNPNHSTSRDEMIRSFAEQDRSKLLELSKPLFNTLKNGDPYFGSIGWIRPDNRVLLRVHAPDKFDDKVGGIRGDIAEVNRNHKALSGFNVGKSSTQYRLIQPVFYDNTYVGAVQFGIHATIIFNALEKKMGTIAGMAILNEEFAPKPSARTSYLKGKTHTIRTKDLTAFSSIASEPDWLLPRQRIILDGSPSVLLNVAPVMDFQGKQLGSFFVILDISKELSQKRKLLIFISGISLLLLLISFLILYYSYGALVEKIITLNQSLQKSNHDLEERVERRTLTLKESQRRLQKFLDCAPLGILIADSETMQLEYSNPTICSMVGYSSSELHRMKTTDLHREVDIKQFAKQFKGLISGKESTVHDTTFVRKDGSLFVADIIAAPIEHEGRTALIGFIVDRTEMKTLGEQLRRAQKMEAIGMMAGGVAHDLNNILSGVISYPELMLMQLPESSKLREPILAVQDAGKRAATVVADLLTVARGAASTREPHNINTLMEEYCNSQEYSQLLFAKPDILCQNRLEASTAIVSCSPTHIKKILINLLGFSFESCEEKGSIILSTSNVQVDATHTRAHDINPGHYILFEINDSGPTMSSKDLEHLFEPFYSKKVMGRSGTGLELAVVWNTVQDHDGRIFVSSSEEGTSFQIYLPLVEESTDPSSTNDLKKQPRNKEDQRILVVDDEPQLRDIAVQMLQALGYTVEAVASGEEALEYLAEHDMDLIILDMLMDPGITGLQTFQEILKSNPKQKAIIASGFSESDDIKEALKLGASKFIKKPYTMNILDTTIQEVLELTPPKSTRQLS